MKNVELYGRVRYAVQIEGLSERAAARRYGIDPRTVHKMMKFSVPPGYVRKKPPAKLKLDPFIPVIDRILGDDKPRPKKQHHTAKRIFERLRDEYGFTGGITIVKDYVAGWRQRTQEMFVPLVHPPGHAQADFGEAIGIIGGVERKIHFFAFDLPHSDACFVVGYPAETTEAFCDGHVRAFAFFGGVPKSILYDNTKIAVARILGDGKRQRTCVFTELQSHYLFEDRFGRPGKGNDKGKVEGLVGYAGRNFLVPIPVFESFEALNAYLLECCRRRMADCLRSHDETIGERLKRDLAALQTPLPAPYDACEKVGTTVSSLSLVRYRLNDYSVPTTYGHRGYGDLSPGKYSLASCFLIEVIATFFFLYVIIGTTSKGAAVGFAGIPIGLCLTLIHLFLIPVTNASVNPARSTGPALFAGGAYIAQLWLFWLAPILGAAIAGVISRWQHDLPEVSN